MLNYKVISEILSLHDSENNSRNSELPKLLTDMLFYPKQMKDYKQIFSSFLRRDPERYNPLEHNLLFKSPKLNKERVYLPMAYYEIDNVAFMSQVAWNIVGTDNYYKIHHIQNSSIELKMFHPLSADKANKTTNVFKGSQNKTKLSNVDSIFLERCWSHIDEIVDMTQKVALHCKKMKTIGGQFCNKVPDGQK